MERKDELKVLMKALLQDCVDAIGDNMYSNDLNEINLSSKDVVLISNQIQEYLNELEGKKLVGNDFPEVMTENEL